MYRINGGKAVQDSLLYNFDLPSASTAFYASRSEAMGIFAQSQPGYEALPLISEDGASSTPTFGNKPSKQKRSPLFNICWVLSVTLNVVLITYMAAKQCSSSDPDSVLITKYAGLARNIPTPFNSSSPYGFGSHSETARSLLWESLDTSAGEISLTNDFARSVNLPSSAPFFWDPANRSIYLLNAHHSLHCLRKVRRWVTLSHYNISQLDSYPHLIHCMDHLLQNILCEADDTPMYTSPFANASTGLGQQRMCRSWDKLQDWAEGHTACFAYVNETQGVDAVIQRFRYCPKGSEMGEKLRESFGYPDDWWERRPEDVQTMPKYWENLD